jgi:asparagine synthase (glutamine-hydrolysing)
MCGVAALFARSMRDLSTLASSMASVIRHRGPDDEGIVLFGGQDLAPTPLGGPDTPRAAYEGGHRFSPVRLVDQGTSRHCLAVLANRRLAILDLSASGHQPMSDPEGRYWVTYNGEIYNHVELHAQLKGRGHRFVSNTDTEVLLHAYREWGEDCLQRFNGMFAFVLLDRVDRRVFAARDRLGVKPLYYYWSSADGLVAFASEIKQFSVLPGWAAVVNGQRAFDFINWGVLDHTSETLFRGVAQLRGGEYVSAALDELASGVHPRRWYTLTPSRSEGGEPAKAYGALLEDAVRLRLRADVSVGSCLSGGLDSSAIVCLANRQLRLAGAETLQKTFSARSSDARVDEGRFIEAVVRHAGVANFQVEPPAQDLFPALPEMTWHQDEPFGSTSIYAQWHVFALAAAHGVKVMLDGQGADEQLGGYVAFFSARFANLVRRGRFITLLEEMRAARRLYGWKAPQLLAYAIDPLLPEFARQPLRQLSGRAAAAGPACLDLDRIGARPEDPSAVQGRKAASIAELSQAQILRTSLPMLLHWEDRDSMAHSVEARVPFVDYRLMELALGLPEESKLSSGVTKRVLRDALADLLPREVSARTDKIGFATAEEQWLRRERPGDFRAAMRTAVEASQGILRPSALELLEDVIAGRRPFSQLPWRMISFGAWMQRFDVRLA